MFSDYTRIRDYEDFLKNIEGIRAKVMREINLYCLNEDSVRETDVFPMAKSRTFDFEGQPILQLSYEGMLPQEIKPKHTPEYFDYISKIRHYYYRSTFDSYEFVSTVKPTFDKSSIFIISYFEDMRIRDLDNLNKKYIIDAIRKAGIIEDDDWQHLTTIDKGFYDKDGNHVQVFVVPDQLTGRFFDYLMENHNELKRTKGLAEEKKAYIDGLEKEENKPIKHKEPLAEITEIPHNFDGI